MRLDSLDTCVELLLIITDENQYHSILIYKTKVVRFCLCIFRWMINSSGWDVMSLMTS